MEDYVQILGKKWPYMAAALGVVGFLLKKYVTKSNLLFLRDFFGNGVTISQLMESDIFVNESNLKNRIRSVKFENKIKTDLIIILLECKLEAIIKSCNKLLSIKCIAKMPRSEFCNLIARNPVEIVSQYEQDIKCAFVAYFGKKHIQSEAQKLADEAFSIIYHDADFGFYTIHDKKIQLIFRRLENIAHSKQSNLINLHILFSYYYDAMANAIIDTKEVVGKLNGRLSAIC